MFIGKLYKFQEYHKNNLLNKCLDNDEIILTAPTGSGMTVLACSFIEDYLDENPKTVFLWFCPGAGGLHKQSKDSYEEVTTNKGGDVYDFIGETDPSGNVYFINWEKINRTSNIALKDGEYKNLMDRVNECHNSGIGIFMLIDEEHLDKKTADEYIINIRPKHVLKISATPKSQLPNTEIITDDEVIMQGLIAEGISINEGVSDALSENNNQDDDLLLIKLADEKRQEIQKEYDKLNLNIRPLVLIQFPNGNEERVEKVKNTLSDMGYSENSGVVTSWFSGDHPDKPEEIKKLNGEYSFLLFKQAIARGWDCPRAKILVKLREGGTEEFNIQTIGRIRRMPERKHYDVRILDNCYVYTLDNRFKEGLTNSLSDSFYTSLYKVKQDCPNITLKKIVLDGEDIFAVDSLRVMATVKTQFLQKYDLDENGNLTKKELERGGGYIFGTILKNESFEGVARTQKDIRKLNKIFAGEHEIDNHDDGFIIRDAKRRIARAMNLDEHIANQTMKILFAPVDKLSPANSQTDIDFENLNKLIDDMSLREYNAFLVNNKERIIADIQGIDEREYGKMEETKIKECDWSIPKSQYYKYHKKIEATKKLNKNVFTDYSDNILHKPNRSVTEIEFENWCEENQNIKWVYKNGDKGEEFFSIVYRKGFRRANFYPDYIIGLNDGSIWIIEAKGGQDEKGESNNIDIYAGRKFNALKEYCNQNDDVKFGFVRAVDKSIFISNTEWDENVLNNSVWKNINEIL